MNVLAWVLDALKTHPEPVSMPESITEESTLVELAEARSRLATISQVATELRRLVDSELAGRIPTAFRYGEDIYRPSNGKGSAKVQGSDQFFELVLDAAIQSTDGPALLASLFPASSVRITALPKVAEVMHVSPEGLKDTFVSYDPPSSPLSVMPRSKAPKFLQDLEEGEVR